MAEMEINSNLKVSCIVNYTYDASESDELSIKPGDVIREVERLPGGWWRGELRGRRGMFPDNFVTILSDQPNARPNGVQGRCRAVFSYQPANPDELPLYVGDVIDVLGEVEEGWWQGRRQGRVGVFPSNFVVMLDSVPVPSPSAPFDGTSASAPVSSPAPALPPKPVKEQCRVLFAYTAVNEDELTLKEGDVVTIVSKDAPDRGWWRGELHGRIGLFPDNFVQLLPPVAQDMEEKKPERPPSKGTNSLYPVLNKYSEKTASVKELTTSKISSHKENSLTKEVSSQSVVTSTTKSESEKLIHSESVVDGGADSQVKKPPVPLKKSPTSSSGVGGLLSGLKNKMLSSDKEKSATAVSSSSSSSGEWDRLDGSASSKPASVGSVPAPTGTTGAAGVNLINNNTGSNTNTFDHIERNSILNDPRAGRVKAPRRRPPSQVFRDDGLQIGLSNGHEAAVPDKPAVEKEEIKPRAREWEKHKAPWMEELKLNQAKKTSIGPDGKPRLSSDSASASKTGSTDRLIECGLEEKRSTHSMEMSKSTSSITNRISVLESFEETRVRHSSELKRDVPGSTPEGVDQMPTIKPVNSPTAAGRTLISMLDDIKKPPAPSPPGPPSASIRTSTDFSADKSNRATPDKSPVPVVTGSRAMPDKSPGSVLASSRVTPEKAGPVIAGSRVTPDKMEGGRRLTPDSSLTAKDKTVTAENQSETSVIKTAAGLFERSSVDRIEKSEERISERSGSVLSGEKSGSGTLERRLNSMRNEGSEALVAQLRLEMLSMEKKFNAAIEELTVKLQMEIEKRMTLQAEVEKLAQCVTQV